ncbi:MAG: 16S rRNA (guanine(527)-N(7))-methyltransferase RsmG [Puniceicoccaceae bacterium]
MKRLMKCEAIPLKDRELLLLLEEHLRRWNQSINLVSRKSVDELWSRHLHPCYRVGEILPKNADSLRVADVGCGGGLPGLPLAIRFPAWTFTMIDSVGKKLRAIEAIAGELGLSNVKVVHARAEAVRGPFEIVTGRAVADFDRFIGWTKHLLNHRAWDGEGIYYLKGGNYAEELNGLGLSGWKAWALSELCEDESQEDKAVIHLPTRKLIRPRSGKS